MKVLCAAVAAVFADAASAQALPTGGATTQGSATISTPTSTSMVVSQSSQRAILEWTSFNIGNGASVTFSQPGASSIAVNRVGVAAGASAIDGMLNANGHVMILNPNGVMFGATASVNVGGLIASTGNINDDAFMTGGSFAITGATSGAISNAARPVAGHLDRGITVSDAGLVAFVAPSVSNSGTIQATGGRIVLASAQAATISMNAGLYEIVINQGVANGTLANTGTLTTGSAAGSIVLSARDAANIVSGAINLEGVQQASRIEVHGGHVVLKSDLDAAVVTGTSKTIDVCNCGHIQDGIDIAATGATVNVGAGTYAEQLTITKSLSLLGASAEQTIIAPTSLAADSLGMRSILTIAGVGTSAEVSGFTLKGPVPEINAGIFVRDGAFAHIHDNKLVDIRESAALSGNQRGIGIFVGRALLGTSGSALIENNVITGYQKGGIVVDGPGSQATITGNIVTGEGPTGVTAQNGIQAGRGASATITGNTISRNSYTGDDDATGILVFTPGANLAQGTITVGPNTVSDNEVGIWTNDPRTLTRISLAGVSGNTRNAVADFGGGYTGQGTLLEYPAWSPASTAYVNPGAFTGVLAGNIVDAGGGALGVAGWSGFTAIQPAIDAVAAGATVNISSGTYTQTATLNVNKSLTLAGAGESQTTIDSRGVTAATGGYGISVTADNVTLKDFTAYGPSAFFASAYGIKVAPIGGASARLHDFTIQNVTSRGAGKAELDLNGVVGATIDHVTANGAPAGNDSGTTAGAGIQITDSADVTITNSTTRNNAWGGVALFQTNRSFDQQTTGITVQNNNTFTEINPLYLQDESASKNFGALSLLGFNYAVRNAATVGSGSSLVDYSQYTWLQAAPRGAFDLAVNLLAPNASYIQGWSGTALTQSFHVGVGNLAGGGTRSMSIMTAIGQSATGATVNVYPGSYAESVVLNEPRNLMFNASTIQGLTINPEAAGSGIGGSATANTALGFKFDGPVVLLSNTTLSTTGANITLNGDIQAASGSPYALSLMAGTGDVSLMSGGAAGNPLGMLQVASNNFTLTGTLWVSGYAIDALGLVTLSDHTLRSVGAGNSNSINAGGDVTGSTISEGGVKVESHGDVAVNITTQGDALVVANSVSGGSINASNIVIEGHESVTVNVTSPHIVEVHSNGATIVSGSAPTLVVDAVGGSVVSGNFTQVSNDGPGVIKVNGKPQGNATLSANADNSRVIPSESTISRNIAANSDRQGGAAAVEALNSLPASAAGEALDLGRPVELDLTPGNDRRR